MKRNTFFSLLKAKSVAFLAFAFIFSATYAQSDYAITFQDDAIVVPENIDTFQWNQMPASSRVGANYIGWVQFYETPTQAVQDMFKANNLNLINYIPNRTYLFQFPQNTSVQFLKDNGVRAIVPVEGRFKLASVLKNMPYPEHVVSGDDLLVTLSYHKNVSAQYVISDLANKQIGVVTRYDHAQVMDLRVPINCLENLSDLGYIKYIDAIPGPTVKEDIRGRGIHRSSNLDTGTLTGRDYTGDGVSVLVRDDGRVGPHIDFEGRMLQNVTSNSGNHGDGVAGILAGAGNLNPRIKGMAASADVYVTRYPNGGSILDPDSVALIDSETVQIANSSYGNGCNDGYTTNARSVDLQINEHTSYIHFFSCGNSNALNCQYGAGPGWATITGGHKQAKNVIATASTRFNGSLSNFSSWGPATDGRIKPDLTAHGEGQASTANNNGYQSFGGTSAASPGSAGVAAQLYEVYADANGGTLPQSALIKATMLNTAQDYGNIGPDFKFGWGMLNGLRAAQLIEDGRYLSDNITQGGANQHVINVPAGTVQARFMVYWNDPAGAAGAAPALVNDLDMVVTDPSSGTHLPYILDPTPNPTALDTPATNGIDRLNNVEQVVFNNPASGNYTLDIAGFNVPMGPQEYFVVYEIITENLTVTYPNEGEKFVIEANSNEIIHWDAINTAAAFVIEFSDDNGGSWTTVGNAAATATNFTWTVPTAATGEGLIRVTSGSHQDVSDVPFSIAPRAVGITFQEVCETTATIQWLAATGAESYDVHVLGEKYMDLVGNTTDLNFTFPIVDVNEPIYASVVARNDTDGWVSRRQVATEHAGGLLNCALGVDENTLAANVLLYPNPAENLVTLEVANNQSDLEITVANLLGQTMERLTSASNETTINVGNYKTGIYFVTIKAGSQTTSKKLLVK